MTEASLDTCNISFYYDGKIVMWWAEIDLRTKFGFRWGDRESQIQGAMVAISNMQDGIIADLQESSVSFPAYQKRNEITTEYLKESDYGVLLSSQRGCITAESLFENDMYHSGVNKLGKFEKLFKREEKVIFSLEDYIQGVVFKKYDPLEEIRIVYGKKPKPGLPINKFLEIRPVLMSSIHSYLGFSPL